MTSERSLSILFPVHNAEATLARNVARVLEIAPELTDRFEVLIIDDGSTDGTDEVAEDLSRMYPQVSVLRHEAERGLIESIQTGLRRSAGEVVFVRDRDGEIDIQSIIKLWRFRDDPDIAFARRSGQASGIQMIRRQGAAQLGPADLELAESVADRAGPRRRTSEPCPAPAAPNYLFEVRDFVLGE